MRELVSLVLQTGHGRRGQGVGVLGQCVQNFAVHITAHKVADQLYLTGVVFQVHDITPKRKNGGNSENGVVGRGGAKLDKKITHSGKMIKKETKKKKKIQWKQEMKGEMRHADKTLTQEIC